MENEETEKLTSFRVGIVNAHGEHDNAGDEDDSGKKEEDEATPVHARMSRTHGRRRDDS